MVFFVCVPCHTYETFSKETETGDDMMANRTIIITGERRSNLFFGEFVDLADSETAAKKIKRYKKN